MFKKASDEDLLKRGVKDPGSGRLNKLRLLEGLPLRKINDSLSSHSSVQGHSQASSIRSFASSALSRDSSLRSSLLIRAPSPSNKKQAQAPHQSTEQLLERHFTRGFTRSLVEYLNRDWSGVETKLVEDKKLQGYVSSVVQRSNWLKQLLEELVEKQWVQLPPDDQRGMVALMAKESTRALKDYERIIPDIVKRVPDERLVKQQVALQDLFKRMLELYDPKFAYSQAKMKERMALYLEEFASRRNELKADALGRIRSTIIFIETVEEYFSAYQREVIRLKSQLSATENERDKYHNMLNRNSAFKPIHLDYDRLYQLRQQAQDSMREDVDKNLVTFHEDKHVRDQKTITKLEKDEEKWRLECEDLREEVQRLKDKIDYWDRNKPQKAEAATQAFLVTTAGQGSAAAAVGSALSTFLDKVVTPFAFSKEIAGSLMTVLTVDKILWDYELINKRLSLRPMPQFLVEWFVIRTGCKRIGQIFLRNFVYSLRQLRGLHKRFGLMERLCGCAQLKGRNMGEDLEILFFSTHLCWYYWIRLGLMYRGRVNENPTGYPMLPPLPCEDVFKVPLRKVYEMVEQFCKAEDIELPGDYTNRIDRYCINEISKFRSNDDQFQKEPLEEIHILKDINFDLIAGFVLEFIAQTKCAQVEQLLRTIAAKQQQEETVIGYSAFETVYRRFFKERKAKVEQVYAKLCQVNMHDLLNVSNVQSLVLLILEDEHPLRTIFERLQPLKALIVTEKTNIMKAEKRVQFPNNYEHFRERYYHEFYDFYDTTALLEDIFKIAKKLAVKRLKKGKRSQQDAELQGQSGREGQDREGDVLSQRLEEWGKLMAKVPHFTSKVLTIDQIVVHNMRRKEMMEASEYAWRTMREILIILGRD